MRIGVLGTGDVGKAIGSRLVGLGHEVTMGSRTRGNDKAVAWVKEAGAGAREGTFSDAASFGELLFNCTKGEHTMAVLEAAGAQHLKGKILVDIANPLDFSKGFPPSLSVCNTDSLGEEVQRTYPELKVVKGLNTMANVLMVRPRLIEESHHTFLSGNDAAAKDVVRGVLESFGWRAEEILDLGDITTARGTEAYLLLWVRIYSATQNPVFNLRMATAS